MPQDYLSDTPLLRAMGLLVSQHGQLGATTPPPFLSLSPFESMRRGGVIPPPPYTREMGTICPFGVFSPVLQYFLLQIWPFSL